MRKVHTTSEGKSLPIASMNDEHLTNMCGVAHKRARALRLSVSHSLSELDAYLMGYEEITPREAAERIEELMEDFTPYFLEAYLRGLEGPQRMLREIYNRDTGVPANILPELPDVVDL